MRAYTRHQLKHDRFAETVASGAADTFSWAGENRGTLIVAAVVAALVLAAGLGYWFYNQQQSDKANIALGHALHVYETLLRPPGTPPTPGVESFSSLGERSQAARREFNDVAEEYPRSAPGRLARYFVGITFRDEGNYPAAEKALNDAAAAGNADVAALARFALAQMYSLTNRPADAIKQLKELADHPAGTVAKAEAQVQLADLYQQQNQPAEAVRLFEQVKSENPNTPAAEYAQTKLAELNKGAVAAPSAPPLAK